MKAFNKIPKIILIILIFIHNLVITAQTSTERINEIKKMYGEVVGLGKINCQEKKMIDYQDVGGDINEVEQKAEVCHLNSIYTLRKGIISKWEYSSEIFAYYNHENLFFVFVKYIGVAYEGELRFYFHKNGDLIQILEKDNLNGEELSKAPNVKVEDSVRKSDLLHDLKSDVEKIQLILIQN